MKIGPGGSVVDIAHGGTNATTASAALANLGASSATLDGTMMFKGGIHSHYISTESGHASGYFKVADFTVTQTYANMPICLMIISRSYYATYVEFCLSNGSSLTNHDLAYFRYAGQSNCAFIWHNPDNKANWQLWWRKSEPYDATEVGPLLWCSYQTNHFDWQWKTDWAKDLPNNCTSPTPLFPNIITDAEVAELNKKLTG